MGLRRNSRTALAGTMAISATYPLLAAFGRPCTASPAAPRPVRDRKRSMISHYSGWPTQMPIRFSQVELAAVLRGQARRTIVPGPAFLLDEGAAARGLQCVDREAAIAYTAAPIEGM